MMQDLAEVLEGAGLPGWAFPQGCAAPEISFKIERYVAFNRRERLATDPGIAWLRLYPSRVGSFDDVVGQARAFVDSLVAEAASKAAEGGGAAGGAGAAKDAGKGAARVAHDVFGDPIGDGACEWRGGGGGGGGGPPPLSLARTT